MKYKVNVILTIDSNNKAQAVSCARELLDNTRSSDDGGSTWNYYSVYDGKIIDHKVERASKNRLLTP